MAINGIDTEEAANLWEKEMLDENSVEQTGVVSLTHTIHGHGVFTYIKGWFVW